MPDNQEQNLAAVETGLGATAPSALTSGESSSPGLAPPPQGETRPLEQRPVPLEAPPPVTELIRLDESALNVVQTAKFEEDTTPPVDPVAYREANRENDKRDFVHKVLEARKPAPEPPPTQPVAPRIHDQTRAEQEAGRQAVARHEEHYARHPRPVEEVRAQQVFRPGDYVPNQRKGQGNVQPRGL